MSFGRQPDGGPGGFFFAQPTPGAPNTTPGVTEFVIHLAFDDEEMRGITFNHPGWGAAWRQRDFDFFTSETLRRLLRENNVKLVTWREVGGLIRKK